MCGHFSEINYLYFLKVNVWINGGKKAQGMEFQMKAAVDFSEFAPV